MQTSDAHAPCPECGDVSAQPVGYRWWSGPLPMGLVKCGRCGHEYSGVTGRAWAPGLKRATIIVRVALLVLIIVAIMVSLLW